MATSIYCMENKTNTYNREAEFQNIVERYSLLITKVCYYFTTDLAEFKDLRQDVLINIWTGIERIKNTGSPTTWIYRVCFNTCISYWRKNCKQKNKVPVSQILELPDDPGIDMAKYNEMHRLINRLNPSDKAIILMWLDESTYEEIAEVVGVNRNTIATRIKRIKEKLVKLSNQ